MGGGEQNDITLVVPTYNRAKALHANLGNVLNVKGVAEVLIVNDGSDDDTLSVCEQFAGPRLRVLSHPTNRGVATARNTGIDAADTRWILFGEDDCRFPDDYAVVLLEQALRHEADLVGAPLIHKRSSDEDIRQVAASAPRAEHPSMEQVGTFPIHTIETPFIPARALVRRSVFDRVRFYEGFPVNGYREETDFFVQAVRAGFRSIFTPSTFCYQVGTWSGGQHHSSSLRYEYWVLRNNWRFLKRHHKWLAEQGYIKGAIRSQASFSLERARLVAAGVVRARLVRLSQWRHARGEKDAAHGSTS
ncbi:MAG TPA: glycosyltransferase family 2 protein [Solirubrobacteraceae bacterium]|nr:glycosyltransferase family 2 protein [Solirubrobacteraceae bacterium]